MNHLNESTSPYLLQHAKNPVFWYPWGAEALEKAKKEDKPILVSIGYSSCHWCHVMAHESFEDQEVADLMNKYFINIKVDREERPDVDQIYMESIQAMGLNGGWPLNVFLTPDQKPFYGGTYFPKEGWKQLLANVADAFVNHREKLNDSAEKFTEAINVSVTQKYQFNQTAKFSKELLNEAIQNLMLRMDPKWGGIKKAPKFPMPSIWSFMGHSSFINENDDLINHLLFTLDKIADGGIYDHVGGGFARYSVDEEWHVPHFEKMLYDNGQLLSLYSLGFHISKSEKYKQVLEETISWVSREMTNQEGGFYSALDADSEGVEGKFYVWSIEEIESLAGNHLPLITKYFDVSAEGNWENTNVLRKLHSDEEIMTEFSLNRDGLNKIIDEFKSKALKVRESRVRPGLDSKVLSGWNGLALKGLIDSYPVLESTECKDLMEKNFAFISEKLIRNGVLLHQYNSDFEGFADDYAAVIQAFIAYYEITFNVSALKTAISLTRRMIDVFFDEDESLFYYTGNESDNLIARKKEFFDNVIPSSNSMMAENLIKLGKITDNQEFTVLGYNMVNAVSQMIAKEPEYLAQWGTAALWTISTVPEVAIIGKDAPVKAREIQLLSSPFKVLCGSNQPDNFPALLEHKTEIEGKTGLYVCFDKTCKKPVTSIEEVLLEMNPV